MDCCITIKTSTQYSSVYQSTRNTRLIRLHSNARPCALPLMMEGCSAIPLGQPSPPQNCCIGRYLYGRLMFFTYAAGASSSLTRIAYLVRYVRLAKTVFCLPVNCYATVKVVSFTAFRGGFREKYYSHELCLLCQNLAHLSIFIFVGEKAHTPS